ncbi:imelysin [Leptospira semungkisensis]|uniref:Imelysin n=1 Tax=Leptospira semungkisensis TaxID=2484985 RepID=A0A4R9FMN7_9LEPT|nr:imelysin family protein [Leptospira semungkisensis]TGJ99703.1 imelysin [Leptospira semungkisensis]
MRPKHTKWQETILFPWRSNRLLIPFWVLFSLFLILFLFVSCTPKNSASAESGINGYLYRMFNSFDPKAMLSNMGTNVMPPLYADLGTQADDLLTKTNAIVGGCSSGALSGLQTSWLANMSAVQKVEMFRFGIMSSPYVHVDPFSIEYLSETPPINDDLDDLDLFSGSSLGSAQVYINGLDRDARGLTSIEYILFSKPSPNWGTAPDCSDFTTSRTYLLQALVVDYNNNIHTMSDAWNVSGTNYGAQIANAGSGSTSFTSSGAALDAILTGAIQLLTIMKDGKLEIPADLSKGGDGSSPDSSRPESRFSANSFQNLQDNLSTFKIVYNGNGTGAGLSDYVKFYSPDLDTEITSTIADLETVLATTKSTGGWGSSNLPNIKAAVKDIGHLLTILNTELAAITGAGSVSGGPGGDGD